MPNDPSRREKLCQIDSCINNDVSKCAYNATVIDDGTAPGTATVQAVDAKTLRVRTRQTDGTLADRAFHLTATC